MTPESTSDRPTSVKDPSMTSTTLPTGVAPETARREGVFDVTDLSVSYGTYQAVREVSISVGQREVTALIGPSECGKSTVLRCLNRMNDLIPGTTVRRTRGVPRQGPVRRPRRPDRGPPPHRHGLPEAQPVPQSIFDNIAYGPRVNGIRDKVELAGIVECVRTGAALWEEVKDKLKTNALALSGGQQQRLCIARTIAVQPEVILMDEPCSALDPIATMEIEDLMHQLTARFTMRRRRCCPTVAILGRLEGRWRSPFGATEEPRPTRPPSRRPDAGVHGLSHLGLDATTRSAGIRAAWHRSRSPGQDFDRQGSQSINARLRRDASAADTASPGAPNARSG
jgi:phosphate transport system ATP-binding protein